MRPPKSPDAIELLTQQHRDVDCLFRLIEQASGARKQQLVEQLADSLAVHTAIEEKIFYPTVNARRTEDILLEALEEHLLVKRVLADIMATSVDDETFDAKLTVLREQIEHHVEEEESDLFPKVECLFDEDQLEGLGQEMIALADELAQIGSPRLLIPGETGETDEAAPLSS